ncbi:carboxypeptidase [Favolaschia claudopus]|uniref:Carboxypeptidase n=1 Tax=Favolaschia claudopus TaxID=2862362 RepID=A0AAW0DYG1_9AGAR
MGKRPRLDEYESSDCSESGSDREDYVPPAKAKRKQSKAKLPSTKAEVTIRATDTPLSSIDRKELLDKVDVSVIARIKKALALASHPQTGETEARAALRMASKLLERHNVTQAEVMAQETESEQLKRAGTSVVSLKSTAVPPKTVSMDRWTSTLAHAMNSFFDCQSYSTKFTSRPRVDWSFYGLAEQTVAAAHAFEMCYNLILAWSLKDDVGKGVHAKNCYRTGVANGLHTMAKKEKEQDKSRAEKKEQALLKARQEEEAAEDKARLDRLEGPEEVKVKKEEPDQVKAEADSESDRRVKIEEIDENDAGNRLASDDEDLAGPTFQGFGEIAPDFNDEDDPEDLLNLDDDKSRIQETNAAEPSKGLMGPPPPVLPKVKAEPNDDESPWNSVGQLVAFREQSIAIGDDYLKSQGVKLKKGRKRKRLEFKDSEALRIYKKGQKDAQNIDVRQKRVKDVGMD